MSSHSMPFGSRAAACRFESWKRLLPESMITSPGSRISASCPTMASVASPDGTLITTWRGGLSMSRSRSIGSATVIRPPFSGSFAISAAVASVRFQATTSCPPRAARRAMPAPIRPSPQIATCMCASSAVSFRGAAVAHASVIW